VPAGIRENNVAKADALRTEKNNILDAIERFKKLVLEEK
jgi:hypothetical protein